MTSLYERGVLFRELHHRPGAFIMSGPWDIGSTRILRAPGFGALAPTSAGDAFSLGKPDGSSNRRDVLAHVASMSASTDLPPSADLENGFGEHPEVAAPAVRDAAAAGAELASIFKHSSAAD